MNLKNIIAGLFSRTAPGGETKGTESFLTGAPVIDRTCDCGHPRAEVTKGNCMNQTPITVYTCTQCGHPKWSCEEDLNSPCRAYH